jgi:hypothetical protein
MNANARCAVIVGILGFILAGILYPLHPSELSKTFAQNKPPQPVWEVDLTKFGYQGRPPIYLGPADIEGHWTYEQGVFFTESTVVAAFFIVRDDPSGAASEQRKFSPSDRFRLEAAFFNSENGGFLKKFDRPLAPGENGVQLFPATNGRFIVGIGNKLSLYSPDLKILAEYISKSGIEDIVSPSGETVLLGNMQLVAGQWSEQFDLLETESLTVLKSWKSYPQQNQMLWGDEIVTRTLQSISIRTPDTEPRRVVEGRDWFCGDGSFVNKETMALFQCGPVEKLFIVSTNGTILHQFDLGLEKTDGPVVASRNGTRFALPTQHWGSGRNKDPEKLLARVFGLDADEPILTVGVTPHYSSSPNFFTGSGDTRFGWGGLALSPDGELVAVKSGPIVQLYRVPKTGLSTGCSGKCAGNEKATTPRPPSLPQRDVAAPAVIPARSQIVEQALSWLPSDTETVTAANGPFLLPDLNWGAGVKPSGNGSEEIADTFRAIPVALLGFKKGFMSKYLSEEKVLLALEGSRNFRFPTGLGEGPFQGCGIVVFAGDVTASVDSFRKDSSSAALRTERIEGQQVSVFQEKLEEDTWTTFVAFPKPNIAVAATNEEYLREVLARINGKRGERALPENLPEWKYVNRNAAFWAVRHYDKMGASTDPTSPFAAKSYLTLRDDQAIGLTFSFDPDKSKTATVTYLSADKNILPVVQKNLFQVEHEPGGREMHIRYREISPGIVEGSFDLDHIESAEVFNFFLMALLGHVIAL